MDRDTLNTLTTELLGGRELGTTLFNQLIDLAKSKRERMRPWVILREEDKSLTVSSSNVFDSPQSLPTGFLKTYSKTPVVLVAGQNVVTLRPLAMNRIHENQNTFGFFYIDYKNNKIGFTGAIDQSYTVHIYMIKTSASIVDSNWSFPDEYHPLLAADVAVMQKGEIDYDSINARMVQFHGLSIDTIVNNMILWDADLQVQEQEV